MDIDVGHILAGKYELAQLIGRGAMGEVWLAKHVTLGGEFAVKLMEPTDEAAFEAASRFQLEAQIAAKLSRRTRHIVSVSDHGEEDGIAYLVMERLEGESLENRVERTGPVSPDHVAAMLGQVARALVLAHEEGILHRDLKPANIWLGRDEDGKMLAKILDFGIARAMKPRVRSPHVTGKDSVLGTPSYMSPEQARGLPNLDHRCDLWALCVSAYEALTGELPFSGVSVEDVFLNICTFKWTSVRKHRPELSPQLDAFFARAFAPELESRFSNARELALAFAAAAGASPPAPASYPEVVLSVPPPPERIAPTSSPQLDTLTELTVLTRKAHRSLGVVAALSVLVVVLLGGGLAWLFRSTRTPLSPATTKQPESQPSLAVIPPPEPPPRESPPSATQAPTTQAPISQAPTAPTTARAPAHTARPAPPRVTTPAPEEPKPPPPTPATTQPPAPVVKPPPAPAKSIDKNAVF
jgi:eukaryotic-like serine/threonine-protein kinase